MKPKYPKAHDKAFLEKCIQSGMTRREIAEAIGIGPKGLGYAAKQIGIELPNDRIKYPQLTKEYLKEARDNGLSVTDISNDLNCCVPTITDRARRCGIRLPRKRQIEQLRTPEFLQNWADEGRPLNREARLEIAELLNCSECMVLWAIRRFGIVSKNKPYSFRPRRRG